MAQDFSLVYDILSIIYENSNITTIKLAHQLSLKESFSVEKMNPYSTTLAALIKHGLVIKKFIDFPLEAGGPSWIYNLSTTGLTRYSQDSYLITGDQKYLLLLNNESND